MEDPIIDLLENPQFEKVGVMLIGDPLSDGEGLIALIVECGIKVKIT